MNKLRQLIRESIGNYISEIDKAGEMAGHKAKMQATEEAIRKRKTMVTLDDLDEDIKQMVDERKVKEVNSEIKALEKSLVKLQKQFDKFNSKANKGEKVEDTEEKEEIIDEINVNLDENEENFDLESYFQKANKEYVWNFDETSTVDDLEYGDESWERTFAKKLMNMGELPYNEWKVKANKAYSASQVNESSDDMSIYEMLHMQKMAGIISESEYVSKINEVKKKKASADMTKKAKSAVVKKARVGKDIDKKKPKSLKEQVKALFENEGNENIVSFLNSNFKEVVSKLGNPGSKFENMGDIKVATAGMDELSGIDISFDKQHMLDLFPENDPYNEVKSIDIAGKTVYYNDYL
jgi:hypothetical protein